MVDDADTGPDRLDEHRRFSAQEWWYLEATNESGDSGVITEVLLDAETGTGRFWYVACLGARTVAVVDNAIPAPSTGLEVRTSGLWFEYRCQHEAELFTVDLEAFGLEIDAGVVIDDGTYGHRVPVGAELEWTSVDRRAQTAPDGYCLDATVEGVLLVGAEELAFTGVGRRRHRWGPEVVDTVATQDADCELRAVAAVADTDGGVVEFLIDPTGRWTRLKSQAPEGLR